MAGPRTSGADFEQRIGQLYDVDEEEKESKEAEESDDKEGDSEKK